MNMDLKDHAYHWVSSYWFMLKTFGGQADLRTDATQDHDSTEIWNNECFLTVIVLLVDLVGLSVLIQDIWKGPFLLFVGPQCTKASASLLIGNTATNDPATNQRFPDLMAGF